MLSDFSLSESCPRPLLSIIAAECGCAECDIVSADIRLCDAQPAALVGPNADRVCGQGIDNLNGTYCALQVKEKIILSSIYLFIYLFIYSICLVFIFVMLYLHLFCAHSILYACHLFLKAQQ